VVNNHGKVLLGLTLSGVSVDELLVIKKENFNQHFTALQINNQFSRTININKKLVEVLQKTCNSLVE
jgi:hypothetical protein